VIQLDNDACTQCMECHSVCPNYVFALVPGPPGERVLELRYPDQCCACGHCIAVCPTAALAHPELPQDQFIPLPPLTVEPEAMQRLLFSRRSVRNYKPDPVPEILIGALLEAAAHAGTSSNGQTEGFLVVRDRKFLRDLERMVIDVLWRAGFKHLGGKGLPGRLMARRFGAEMIRQYRTYHLILKHRRENGELEGTVFRNAPLAIMAHGLKNNMLAQTNCALALRNIELLALTMGLGTCWVGFLVGAADRSVKVGDFIGLPRDRQVYGALMVGYAAEKFATKLPRRPRAVRWI
jgi:nitroreductase/NAD-dependent dihydropyrimidine dehydrogenase PreA subunit